MALHCLWPWPSGLGLVTAGLVNILANASTELEIDRRKKQLKTETVMFKRVVDSLANYHFVIEFCSSPTDVMLHRFTTSFVILSTNRRSQRHHVLGHVINSDVTAALNPQMSLSPQRVYMMVKNQEVFCVKFTNFDRFCSQNV